MITFNEVTWYSKLATIIFFIGVLPSLTFYLGVRYEEVRRISDMQTVQNIPTSASSEKPPIAFIRFSTEGCVEIAREYLAKGVRNERMCALTMSDDRLYTFRYDGETTLEVYKDNALQRTITMPVAPLDPGSITDFMVAADINFDGWKDLGIKSSEGATGNRSYDYYLFNAQTEEFEYSKEFTDTLGFPNAETKEIRSHWNEGCAGGCFSERTYKVENNTPVLILEVEQRLVDVENETFIKITKELKDGVFVTSTSTVTY
ncbi:hypothetical protein HY416_03715 [Candidatus Kaiserbacteria bacterium]|nr:hypothetical protein [Candidatus Kaiserbacteria bacterium]